MESLGNNGEVTNKPLADALKLLGLHHTAEHLDDLVALATKRRWSPTQLLEHLADVEQQERAGRSLERRLLRTRLGRFTPMEAFDWAWPTRIERAAVEAALHLDFLTAGRNCVLVAAQGLGKTMIAQNIAHQAVLAGHHVLFTTAAQLLLDLGSQESARSLARRLNYYGQRGLLVLDELGYLSYDARAADLLFQIVSRRDERKSLVLTNFTTEGFGLDSARAYLRAIPTVKDIFLVSLLRFPRRNLHELFPLSKVPKPFGVNVFPNPLPTRIHPYERGVVEPKSTKEIAEHFKAYDTWTWPKDT